MTQLTAIYRKERGGELFHITGEYKTKSEIKQKLKELKRAVIVVLNEDQVKEIQNRNQSQLEKRYEEYIYKLKNGIQSLTNKQIIIDKLKLDELELGCYDKRLEEMNSNELKKLLKSLDCDSADIPLKIGRKSFILEICFVDSEIDFMLKTPQEYESQYGVAYGEEN